MDVAQVTWSSPGNLSRWTGGTVMLGLHAREGLSVGNVPRQYQPEPKKCV